MELIIQPKFREIVEAQLAILGWSRSELARRTGYKPQMITNYLNDADLNIGTDVMERILSAMGLEPIFGVQPIRTGVREVKEKTLSHA